MDGENHCAAEASLTLDRRDSDLTIESLQQQLNVSGYGLKLKLNRYSICHSMSDKTALAKESPKASRISVAVKTHCTITDTSNP